MNFIRIFLLDGDHRVLAGGNLLLTKIQVAGDVSRIHSRKIWTLKTAPLLRTLVKYSAAVSSRNGFSSFHRLRGASEPHDSLHTSKSAINFSRGQPRIDTHIHFGKSIETSLRFCFTPPAPYPFVLEIPVEFPQRKSQ